MSQLILYLIYSSQNLENRESASQIDYINYGVYVILTFGWIDVNTEN